MASLSGNTEASVVDKTTLCPICLRKFRDPRLLDCLHALCCACINELLVTADKNREIKCSLCRKVTRLPETGATGLPEDLTVVSRTQELEAAGASTCADCADGTPIARCGKCAVDLCSEHVASHLSSPGEHTVNPIGTSASQCSAEDTSSSSNIVYGRCSEHNELVSYFCVTCDVAVCGGCTAVGEHSGHKPIAYLSDILMDRKEAALSVVQRLKSKVCPRLEAGLLSIETTAAGLTQRANEARLRIDAAAKKLMVEIESCKVQLLLQVEDIEQERHKVLDEQKDQLKGYLADMENIVGFSERLQDCRGAASGLMALLAALDKRSENLSKVSFCDKPKERPAVLFLPAEGKTEIDCRSLGFVSACEAVAENCSLKKAEGDNVITRETNVPEGSKIVYILEAKDGLGRPMAAGGDHVTGRWLEAPESQVHGSKTKRISVKDRQDGSYVLTCTPDFSGKYVLEVSVNGEPLSKSVSFTCANMIAFDKRQCHGEIRLSSDNRKATRSSRDGHASVLCTNGMKSGSHTWIMEIGPGPNWYAVGIASKPLSNLTTNYTESFAWKSTGGMYCYGRSTSSQLTNQWRQGDTLRFTLDCDNHTLQVTNLRCGDSDSIPDLPDKQFFAYVNMYAAGNSVKLK